MRRDVYCYLHTHWDREWYRSFESYRYRLGRSLKQILDFLETRPDQVFLLDGQTVVLEDYLAIYPEDAPRLRCLIEAGRLNIGPWFVLPDEFLVSGEALIRNLQLGLKQSLSWGQTRFVGYLPDMFGHVGQMPQLLAQSHLSPALVWRGLNPEQSRFFWQGLSKKGVEALHLTKGYYQDALHQDPIAWELLDSFLEAIESATPPGLPLLLPIGADHMGLPADLETKWEQVQKRYPQYDFKLTSIWNYLDQLPKDQPTLSYAGELRQPEGAYVLPGVWSTRIYLKQANDALQYRLERQTEPLLLRAGLEGSAPPNELLQQAWKYLLLNQPHDSICGCSIDTVHQDMLPRFRWAHEIADDLEAEALQTLISHQAGHQPGLFLHLINSGPETFDGVIEAELVLPRPEPAASDFDPLKANEQAAVQPPDFSTGFVLLDSAGQALELDILERDLGETFVAEPEILPHWENSARFRCLLPAKIAPFGHQRYRIEAVADSQQSSQPLNPQQSNPKSTTGNLEQSISNPYCRLSIDPELGELVLWRKVEQTWIQLARGHLLLDESDAGDEYNYSPASEDTQLTFKVSQVECSQGALYQELKWVQTGFIPGGLSQDRSRRSGLNVPLQLEGTATLYANQKQIQFHLSLNNQARDHRLRLIWYSPDADWQVRASSLMGSELRQQMPECPLDTPKGQERPVDEFPFVDWIHVQAPENRGWAWYSQGLHEAALQDWQGHAALSVTLLRSVGWLSRDDLRTRGGGAGPRMPTPEAQCLGNYDYHYSLHLAGNDLKSTLNSINQSRHQPLVKQGDQRSLPALFEIEQQALHLSALTFSQDRQGLIIRFVNETPEPQALKLRALFPYESLSEIDPTERFYSALPAKQTEWELAPFEILSLHYLLQNEINLPQKGTS